MFAAIRYVCPPSISALPRRVFAILAVGFAPGPAALFAAFDIVASTSYIQSAAVGRFTDISRVTPGAPGVTAFLATLAAPGNPHVLIVNRQGTLTVFRAEEFGGASIPRGASPFLALAAHRERIVVVVVVRAGNEFSASTRVFAIDAANTITPLGDISDFFRVAGTFDRITDLVVQPDGTVALIVFNASGRPGAPNYSSNTRLGILRDNVVTTIAASGTASGLGSISQLSATADALYFLSSTAGLSHVHRWRGGELTRVIDGSRLVEGTAQQIGSYRSADDGAIALFDAASRRVLLSTVDRIITLVPENTPIAGGSPLLFTPTSPSLRVLHVDASHVYFTGVRLVRMPSGFESPQADLVFRVARAGGPPEIVFDPERVFPNPAAIPFPVISIAGGTGPEITALAREFTGSHQAIFRGAAPLGTVRLPAVPAGFPEFHLDDRGTGFSNNAGVSVTLRAETTGTAPASFLWSLNDQPIPAASPLYSGASSANLTLVPFAQAYHQGTYTVAATNAAGTTFASTVVNVQALNYADGVGQYPPLVNISVRGLTGTGDRTLTAGVSLLPRLLGLGFRDGRSFRDYETGTTRRVLLRAIGPGLAPFLPASALPPALHLTLFDGERVVSSNGGTWSSVPGTAAAATAAGAFPLPPASRDAALLVDLEQKNYTAQVTAPSGEGTALFELYAVGGSGNIRNISARAHVGDAEPQTLTFGFVIAPKPDTITARTILLRAVGPGLQRSFAVATASPRPQLELYQGATLIAANDDHRTAPNASAIANISAAYGAFPLDAADHDAALLLSLPPGAYTARITAAPGSAGVVLAELYTNVGF